MPIEYVEPSFSGFDRRESWMTDSRFSYLVPITAETREWLNANSFNF